MPERKITTDHHVIRSWVEARQGKPMTVRGTGGNGGAGVLRIDFPGHKGTRLQEITWEEFFRKFDEKRLALLYQETTSEGGPSRFCKLIRRETVGLEGQGAERLQGERPVLLKPPEPSQPEDESRWEGESPAAAHMPD